MMLRSPTLLSVAFLLAVPLASYAQGIGSDEITRQANRGNVGPYEGASYYERYHYGNIQPLYLNWNSRQFYEMEYLDRLDRQEKFGSRWPSAKYGSEFQVERINREFTQRMEKLDTPSNVTVSVGGGGFFSRFRR